MLPSRKTQAAWIMTKGIFTLFPAAERLFASKAKDDSKSVQANKHSRHPSTWVVFYFSPYNWLIPKAAYFWIFEKRHNRLSDP